MRTPSVSCPSYVCGRIRTILRRCGFMVSRTSGVYSCFGGGTKRSTAGFEIHKVGVSKWVAIGWTAGHADGQSMHASRRSARGDERRANEAIVRAYLRSLGYPIDVRGWIECVGYDSHD